MRTPCRTPLHLHMERARGDGAPPFMAHTCASSQMQSQASLKPHQAPCWTSPKLDIPQGFPGTSPLTALQCAGRRSCPGLLGTSAQSQCPTSHAPCSCLLSPQACRACRRPHPAAASVAASRSGAERPRRGGDDDCDDQRRVWLVLSVSRSLHAKARAHLPGLPSARPLRSARPLHGPECSLPSTPTWSPDFQ